MSGGYISQKIKDEVLCFEIAFYKRRCIVKKNRVLEVPRLLAVIKTDDGGTFLKSYFVADVKITTIFNKDTAMFSVFRLIILPAAALVVGLGLGLDATSLGISVLMTGMPAGATAAIFAARYDSDALFATRCVVMTTLMSMLTLPVWCYLAG